MKRLTLIKIAGVVVSLAAGSMANALELTYSQKKDYYDTIQTGGTTEDALDAIGVTITADQTTDQAGFIQEWTVIQEAIKYTPEEKFYIENLNAAAGHTPFNTDTCTDLDCPDLDTTAQDVVTEFETKYDDVMHYTVLPEAHTPGGNADGKSATVIDDEGNLITPGDAPVTEEFLAEVGLPESKAWTPQFLEEGNTGTDVITAEEQAAIDAAEANAKAYADANDADTIYNDEEVKADITANANAIDSLETKVDANEEYSNSEDDVLEDLINDNAELIEDNAEAISDNTDAIETNKTAIESNDQDIADIQTVNNQQWDAIDANAQKNVEQDDRLDSVESKNVEQDSRLDSVEAKNAEQDAVLADHEVRITDNRTDIDALIADKLAALTALETKLAAALVEAEANVVSTAEAKVEAEEVLAEAEEELEDIKANTIAGHAANAELIALKAELAKANADSLGADARDAFVKNVQADVDAAKASGAGDFEVIAAKLNSVTEQVVTNTDDIAELDSRVTVLEDRVDNLEQRVFTIENPIEVKESLADKEWTRISILKMQAERTGEPGIIVTSQGKVLDIFEITAVHNDSMDGFKYTVSKRFAYEVNDWNSTWVRR